MYSLPRRFSSLFLVVILLYSLTLPILASDSPPAISPDSSAYLSAYSADLTAISGCQLPCTVDVSAVIVATQIGAKNIYIYESQDGVSFSRVANYSYLNHPDMMGSGVFYIDTPITYIGHAGYYYYASVKVYAGNSTGGDSRWYNTAVVQCHN